MFREPHTRTAMKYFKAPSWQTYMSLTNPCTGRVLRRAGGKLKLDSEYIVTLKPNNARFRHSGVVLVF
jgi:hypothetical protein